MQLQPLLLHCCWSSAVASTAEIPVSAVTTPTVIRILTSTVVPIMTTIHGLTGTASVHTGTVTMFIATAANHTGLIAMGNRITTTGNGRFMKGLKVVNVWTTGPGSGNHQGIVTAGRQVRFMAAIAMVSEDIPATVATGQVLDRSDVSTAVVDL